MVSLRSHLVTLLLLQVILLLSHPVKSDDEDKRLLQDINSYRATLYLSALTENDNAGCLAGEMADQFKNQPCTNGTGANTVPGTEMQLANYPDLLNHCHLNVSNTRDGVIMPACVPDLVPSLVLANFTGSQYSSYLNDSKYTGAGISSEGDWIVVILTTNTPEGSYATYKSASVVPKAGMLFHLFSLFLGLFLALIS